MHVYTSPFPPVQPLTSAGIFNSLFLNNPRVDPSSSALIDASTGTTVSYASLIDSSLLLASGLSRTLPLGSTVILLSPNSLLFPTVLFGCIAAGLVVSGASPSATVGELRYQIEDSQASIMIVAEELGDVAREAAREAGWGEGRIYALPRGDGKSAKSAKKEGIRSWQELNGEKVFRPVEIKDPFHTVAYLPYSSGTTGKPKGVLLSHANVEAVAQQCRQVAIIANKETTICSMPLYHAGGLIVSLHIPFLNGGTVCLMGKFELSGFCRAIQTYQCKGGLIAPPMALVIAKNPIVDQYDLKSMDWLLVGAAPLSAELQRSVQTRLSAGNTKVVQACGMSETTAVCLVPDMSDFLLGSCGKPLANTAVRLVDDDGKDVYPGDTGELWLRGPNIMMGYHNNATATAETVTPDGWLKTGDIAQRTPSGNISIVDRKKELIKTNAFQVAPAELEAVLINCPHVLDCTVIGVWSAEKHTEFPRAYVVLHPSAVDLPDIKSVIAEYVASRVAHYKRLGAGVVVVESIPKSPSGKILRKVLRAEVAKEVADKARL